MALSLLFICICSLSTISATRTLNGGCDILLFIQSHNGQHPLEIPSSSTVGEITTIARREEIIFQNSALSFAGQPLSDDDTLHIADAGIGNETVLTEVLRMPNQFHYDDDEGDERFEIFEGDQRIKFNTNFGGTGAGDWVEILSEIGAKEIKLRVLNGGELGFWIIGGNSSNNKRSYSKGDVITLIIDGDICRIYRGDLERNLNPVDACWRGHNYQARAFEGMQTQLELAFAISYAQEGTEIEIMY